MNRNRTIALADLPDDLVARLVVEIGNRYFARLAVDPNINGKGPDLYLVAKWFTKHTLVTADQLRKAGQRGRISTQRDGGGHPRYSLRGAWRLWPELMEPRLKSGQNGTKPEIRAGSAFATRRN